MDPMLGMIFMVPWSWAPYNYQLCQGQIVNIQQYEALYSLTGTVFGGNGSSTFGLPNLSGRAPVGTGILANNAFTIGAAGGSLATTLTMNNLPAHNHAATFNPTFTPQVISIPATTGNLSATTTSSLTARQVSGANTPQNGFLLGSGGAAGGAANIYVDPTTAGTNVTLGGLSVSTSLTGTAGSGAATATINAVTGGTVVTGATGVNAPFSTMQPYLAMSFVIAMNGLYPDRP